MWSCSWKDTEVFLVGIQWLVLGQLEVWFSSKPMKTIIESSASFIQNWLIGCLNEFATSWLVFCISLDIWTGFIFSPGSKKRHVFYLNTDRKTLHNVVYQISLRKRQQNYVETKSMFGRVDGEYEGWRELEGCRMWRMEKIFVIFQVVW